MKAKTMNPRILMLLLMLGIIGGGAFFFIERGVHQNGDIVLYGNVDIRQVRLAFFDTGRIEKMHVLEGAQVETGQLVAELNASRYEAAAGRAKAQAGAQREVCARLTAGSRPEEIAEARARVRYAKAMVKDAEQKQSRIREMAKDQYASQQQLDDVDTAVEIARANLQALQQTAMVAVKGPREEDIAVAQAQLKAYEAANALADQELADTKLYAPTNGIVQSRILEPGDMASPQSPVYTLALNDPIWVRVYIPEPELGKIAEGMSAKVTTDSFPGKTYEGWIGYISPIAEFTPKQIETTDLRTRLVYQVRVFVKNPQNELRLGMPATVYLSCKTASSQEK